ncbi:sortase [Amycolatopsis japonica]|uniref:sortase domain-containing protein n=1 Tax=Amycolatopsis japonica TaxID=208439 RepID=UPI00332ABA8F
MIRPSWRRWPFPLVVGTLIGVVLAAALTACAVPPAGKVASPAPPSSVSSVAEAPPLAPAKPVRLEIPAIGVRTGEIVDLGLAGDGTLQVPHDAITTGWFTGGPAPGEIGPAVLAGHVDYKKVPGVFVRLKELKAGDEALVHREGGSTAVFTVYAVDRQLSRQRRRLRETDARLDSPDAHRPRRHASGGHPPRRSPGGRVVRLRTHARG